MGFMLKINARKIPVNKRKAKYKLTPIQTTIYSLKPVKPIFKPKNGFKKYNIKEIVSS